jgi:hypothetical protein
MNERITLPATAEEKQQLADSPKRRGWSPAATARFLCLVGLDPEISATKAGLAKEMSSSTKPRLDHAALAAEFTADG